MFYDRLLQFIVRLQLVFDLLYFTSEQQQSFKHETKIGEKCIEFPYHLLSA